MKKLSKQFLRTAIAKGCSKFRKLGMKRKRKAKAKHNTCKDFHTPCLAPHVTVTNHHLDKMKINETVQTESKSEIKNVPTVSLVCPSVSRVTKDHSLLIVLEGKSIICPKECLPENHKDKVRSISNCSNKDSTSVKTKPVFQSKENNDLVQTTSYDQTLSNEHQQETPRAKLDMSNMQSVKTKDMPKIDSVEDNHQVCNNKSLKPCETQYKTDIQTESGSQQNSKSGGIRKQIEGRTHVPSLLCIIFFLGVLLSAVICGEEGLKFSKYFDTLRSLLVLGCFLSLDVMKENDFFQGNVKITIDFRKILAKKFIVVLQNSKSKDHQLLVNNGVFDTYQTNKIWTKQPTNITAFPAVIELNNTSFQREMTFSAYYGKTRFRDTTFKIISEHGLYYSGRGLNPFDKNTVPQILQVTCEECKRKVSVYENECYNSARFHDITCEFYDESLETDCSEEDASSPEVLNQSRINVLTETRKQQVLGAEGGQAIQVTDEHETEEAEGGQPDQMTPVFGVERRHPGKLKTVTDKKGKQSDPLTPEPGVDGGQPCMLLSRAEGGQPCQLTHVSGVEGELPVLIHLLGADGGQTLNKDKLFERVLLGKKVSFQTQHNGNLDFIHFCLPAVFGTICQRCVKEKHVYEQLKKSGLNSSEFVLAVGTDFFKGRYGEALLKIASKFDIPSTDNVIDFCPRIKNDRQKYISEETVITEILNDVRIKRKNGTYIPYLESFYAFLAKYLDRGRLNISTQTLVSDWLKSEGSQGFEKRFPPLLILPMYRYAEERTSIVPLFSTSEYIDQQITLSTKYTYRLLSLSSLKQRHLTCYFPWENDAVYYNNEHSENASQVVISNQKHRFIDQKGIPFFAYYYKA